MLRDVLAAYMSVPHIYLVPRKARNPSDHLKLELYMVVRCQVGAGN